MAIAMGALILLLRWATWPGGGSSLLNAAWLAAYVLAGAAFYAAGMFLFGGDEARSALKRVRARITGANGPGGSLS